MCAARPQLIATKKIIDLLSLLLQGVSLPQISSLETPHRGLFRRMPADYEMMIASSPPVFSHSPPVSSCLAANYNYLCKGLAFNNANVDVGGRRRQQMNPKLRVAGAGEQAAAAAVFAKLQALAPRLRPCLVVKPEEQADACKHKKRVVFADAKGLSLTHVSTIFTLLKKSYPFPHFIAEHLFENIR